MINFDYKKFEEEILNQDYYIQDNFFATELVLNLKNTFEDYLTQKKFNQSRIGKSASIQENTAIRSDEICWIENWNDSAELLIFQKFLTELSQFCRSAFYLPLKRFESHFALYSEGSFYKRHLDQHKNSPHRQISIILYLSEFKPDNGGELIIYPNGKSQIKISPIAGRLVVFKSADLPHEVLVTHAKRCSLTSWLRDDEDI